jgi:signal transduction histidine kinase
VRMRHETRLAREDVPARVGRRSPDNGVDGGHTAVMSALVAADRTLRVAGWSVAALSALLVATVPVSLSGSVLDRPGVDRAGLVSPLLGVLVVVGFVIAGVVLVQLRPRNLLGWLLLVTGLLHAVSNSAGAYGVRALTDPDGSLPLGLFSTWWGSCAAVPAVLVPTLVMPALYPTGRAPSPFWAWYVRVCLVGTGLLIVASATVNSVTNESVAGTRLPWDTPPWWVWATAGTSALLLVPAVGVVVVGTLVRVARARSPERQQLLWLVCVVAVLAATIFLPATEVPFTVTFACLPLAVMVGVLRYRLLGIEVALRRTLLYAPLALLVALVVGGLTTGLAWLFPEGPLPLLAASAVVAVVLLPVAGRLRSMVDRLVLGERPDPLTLVDRVGAGLEVASGDPVASMLQAVATAVAASYAAVRDTDGGILAQVGQPKDDPLDAPLVHAGAELGTLSVGPRRGEPRVTARDARLVLALAPHLAVVVSSGRLTEDLARERQRVAAATVVERDRLRRDLHDGLGPSLSGIALGLEAAGTALERHPESVPQILERTGLEAAAAVSEIRRVLAGLRPASLDRHGLVGAVRDAADQLGMGATGTPHFELRVDPLPPLSSDLEECAFRITAEAMTNVARHSGADHCRVQISQLNGTLNIAVTDDGRGVTRPRSTGHGLDSMLRRAADADGLLTIAPIKPHGTAVTAALPLRYTS